ALACFAHTELKRLVAYSSVGHMGFVLLAVATVTIGGIQAAVFGSVAHGLITGMLFFLAGGIKDRFGTGELSELSALYRKVPRLAGLFAFTAFASLGLPGLAGFWGEVLAIRASLFPASGLPLVTYEVLAVLAAFGVILTTAYFLKLMRGMLQGDPANGPIDAIPDVDGFEWIAWSPLLALTVVLGVAPGFLLAPVASAARAFFWGIQ
ncbi:MAG: proton-conducting transporter membrane subunit, partial [Nocardioidaceae bacterium]